MDPVSFNLNSAITIFIMIVYNTDNLIVTTSLITDGALARTSFPLFDRFVPFGVEHLIGDGTCLRIDLWHSL